MNTVVNRLIHQGFHITPIGFGPIFHPVSIYLLHTGLVVIGYCKTAHLEE